MTSHLERLATRLSATYRLKSTLSSGVALDVYVAEEWKTGRRVIIKALREEKATSTSAARFLSAITSAAQLEHPNIVPLDAFGTVDGTAVLCLAGHRRRVASVAPERRGLAAVVRSPADRRDVSAALDFAQRHHVLHRNLKPEKVLLHGGRAFVADFGLEPAVGGPELPRRGMPGSLPGTPEYMSPEQAQGDTDCDGRSDVYSLACIVYEMIWGRPPFMGPPSLVLRRQISAEPMPLCCRLPGVPHGLAAAVSRALAKEPAHRFASAGAFVAALRDGCDSLEACRPSDRVTAERPIERAAFSVYNTRQSA